MTRNFVVVVFFTLLSVCLSQNWNSCLDALKQGVNSNGPISIRGVQSYCENANNGGGWQLMAKFSQNTSVFFIPQAMYDSYFANPSGNIWITGNSMANPLNPNPVYDGFHIESHNWTYFLDVGKRYQLRQTIEVTPLSKVFDIYYDFVFKGFIVQNGQSDIDKQSWLLTNRYVIQDNIGVTWDSNDTIRFWLPFYPGMTGNILTACGGSSYDTSGCGYQTASSRRYGDAGIIGSVWDSKDPAASWLPHTFSGNSNFDIAFAHQAVAIFGQSGGVNMVGKYWIRALACSRNCTGNQTCVFVNGDQTCICANPLVPDPKNPQTCRTSCAVTPQLCGQNEECRGDDCVCISGFQRNLQTGRCQSIPNLPQTIGQCGWWGDPHFTGFGTKKYDYYGGCDYIVARAGNLEIQARFETCNPSGTVSCGSAIAVLIKDVNVTVVVNYRLNVWVNNNQTVFANTFNLSGGSSITRAANQVKINIADGSYITVFYGNSIGNNYQINLPISYYDGVRGLCGNWNVTSGNILNHRDGNISSDLNSPLLPWSYSGKLVTDFGDSWLVSQSKGDRYLMEPLGPPRCPARKRQISQSCQGDQYTWAIEQCQILLQNPPCTEIDIYAIYQSCIFDVCMTESVEFVSIANDAINSNCKWLQDATALEVTSGQEPITSGSINSGSLTTGSATSGLVTSGQEPITSGSITTGQESITSGDNSDVTTMEEQSAESRATSLTTLFVPLFLFVLIAFM